MNCKTKECSRCCEFVRVEIIGRWDEEYCKARGIKQIEGFRNTLEIPSRCPHLNEGTCDLSNKRPKVCKDFVCKEINEQN